MSARALNAAALYRLRTIGFPGDLWSAMGVCVAGRRAGGRARRRSGLRLLTRNAAHILEHRSPPIEVAS